MACPFVDSKTVQPRNLGWSTHNFGDCSRPIDQMDSAAGELTVHGQKQVGPRGSCRTIRGRQRYVANGIEDPNAMSARTLRQIFQEPRRGRPEQLRTMVTPKMDHGLQRRRCLVASEASGFGSRRPKRRYRSLAGGLGRSEEHTSELQSLR